MIMHYMYRWPHAGATMMLASGASLTAVQEIGGWTTLRMLERYAHPSDAEKRRAVDLASVITDESRSEGGHERGHSGSAGGVFRLRGSLQRVGRL